jgi:hypothetical protein
MRKPLCGVSDLRLRADPEHFAQPCSLQRRYLMRRATIRVLDSVCDGALHRSVYPRRSAEGAIEADFKGRMLNARFSPSLHSSRAEVDKQHAKDL